MRVLEKQGWHLLALMGLLAGVYFISVSIPGVLDGQLWGIPTSTWLVLAIAVPVVHQVYAVAVWRGQLATGWVTNRFPESGYRFWKVTFLILLASRPITAILLAVANQQTCSLPPVIRWGLVLVMAIPVVWLGYSVARYFGIDRAVGADHFDPAYRNSPMVTKGIYKYTSNAMYLYGFLLFWIIGLLFASRAPLVVALFQHLYIWVHYFATEKPDMQHIYGNE